MLVTEEHVPTPKSQNWALLGGQHTERWAAHGGAELWVLSNHVKWLNEVQTYTYHSIARKRGEILRESEHPACCFLAVPRGDFAFPLCGGNPEAGCAPATLESCSGLESWGDLDLELQL